MVQFLVVVGTESGNSQMVADHLEFELPRDGHEVEVQVGEDLDVDDFASREIVLIVTSTHGDGELPDNIIPLQEALEEQKPDLSGMRYGVIALGDQTYSETFCEAGRFMDRLLSGLGATKVGERLEIDACIQPLPDEEALEWAKEWLTHL